MRITICGANLPGRSWCSTDHRYENVHVAVQEGAVPVGLVAADAASARWDLEVTVSTTEGGHLDFKGPCVHGKRGQRFLYLTWGDVAIDGSFHMFRRAKLVLDAVDPNLVRAAEAQDRPLVAQVHLTDHGGGPRCARVDPPALTWSLG